MISTLSDLIAQAESSNNPFAVRFEPLHTPAPAFISRMVVVAACSTETARVLCSTSWGLYQIMGDELMAKGLNMSPVAFCGSAQTQYSMFNAVLLEKGLSTYTLMDIIGNSAARANFAAKYNGPGAVAQYSQYLLDTYNKFK